MSMVTRAPSESVSKPPPPDAAEAETHAEELELYRRKWPSDGATVRFTSPMLSMVDMTLVWSLAIVTASFASWPVPMAPLAIAEGSPKSVHAEAEPL